MSNAKCPKCGRSTYSAKWQTCSACDVGARPALAMRHPALQEHTCPVCGDSTFVRKWAVCAHGCDLAAYRTADTESLARPLTYAGGIEQGPSKREVILYDPAPEHYPGAIQTPAGTWWRRVAYHGEPLPGTKVQPATKAQETKVPEVGQMGTKVMGRPKKYATAAERKAAYRARKRS